MSRTSSVMRLSFVMCVAILAVELGCSKSEQPAVVQQGGAAPSAADRQAIDADRNTMINAMQRGDAAAAAAIYAPDAIFMGQGEPQVEGQPAILASFQATVAKVAFSNVAFTVHDMSMSGDLAVETGRYAYTVTPKGGQAMPMSGKYLVVLRKQADGTWKVWRDIDNNDAPAPAPTAKH